MWDFIVKYWVEVALGIVVAGGSYFIKRLWTLFKNEKANKLVQAHSELITEIKLMLEDTTTAINSSISLNDENLQKQINTIQKEMTVLEQDQQIMKAGMLCLQGDYFKKKCQRYLEPDHYITEEEYIHLCAEHDVYKSLGGNSNGDRLFGLCQEKVKNALCLPPHEKDENQ